MTVVRLADFQAVNSFRECAVCLEMAKKVEKKHREIKDYRMYLCYECHDPYYVYCDRAKLNYNNMQVMHDSECELCDLRQKELLCDKHHWSIMCKICLEKYKIVEKMLKAKGTYRERRAPPSDPEACLRHERR